MVKKKQLSIALLLLCGLGDIVMASGGLSLDTNVETTPPRASASASLSKELEGYSDFEASSRFYNEHKDWLLAKIRKPAESREEQNLKWGSIQKVLKYGTPAEREEMVAPLLSLLQNTQDLFVRGSIDDRLVGPWWEST